MKKKEAQLLSLDLHGFKTDEVFDALDKFIRRAETGGHHRVRIIHGKGTGKVKEKVMEYLRMAGHSGKPEPLANGNVNEGVLLVIL